MAVRNTAVYVLFVPAGMALALALALLVNRRMPGVRLLRAVYFLPYITSFVAISLVWRWMFQPDVGLFNNLLGRIGVSPQPWLSSPAAALPSLMLMSTWMYAGYMMVIFLAGLQSIPETLYESARMDGAGAWQRFRRITLPLLRPTLLFILVTMVIFMFQVFTAVYVMTEGGPLHATDVVVYHIYRTAWEYLRMGYASAMAWVLFALVFLVTLLQFRWLGARTVE
jgi:multiple sugar transport system permease protein